MFIHIAHVTATPGHIPLPFFSLSVQLAAETREIGIFTQGRRAIVDGFALSTTSRLMAGWCFLTREMDAGWRGRTIRFTWGQARFSGWVLYKRSFLLGKLFQQGNVLSAEELAQIEGHSRKNSEGSMVYPRWKFTYRYRRNIVEWQERAISLVDLDIIHVGLGAGLLGGEDHANVNTSGGQPCECNTTNDLRS